MKQQNTTSNQRSSLMLKDLVLIGIFDVIYLVIIMACDCMGIVPRCRDAVVPLRRSRPIFAPPQYTNSSAACVFSISFW